MLHEAELHSTLKIIMVLIIDHFKEKKSALIFLPARAKVPFPAPLYPKILAGTPRVIRLVVIATKPSTGWLDLFFTEMFLQ